MSEKRRAILIAGPTASGKSEAALFLAAERRGVVINADSMQVYAPLRILTARPGPEAEAAVPHALYGHVAPDVRHSAGLWLREAQEQARKAWAEGRIPVFTGGTGLYFRVLEEGLADVPDIPRSIREQVAAMDEETLRAQARRLGVDAARDRQRLARALEVRLATGRRLEDFHARACAPGPLAGAEILRLFIAPPREALRARIAERFSDMLRQGAAEEVRALMALGLDPELPVMKALGVREIAAALAGEIAMEEAAQRTIAATRRYARRQMTWARRYMRGWLRAESAAQALALAAARGW